MITEPEPTTTTARPTTTTPAATTPHTTMQRVAAPPTSTPPDSPPLADTGTHAETAAIGAALTLGGIMLVLIARTARRRERQEP